MERIVIRRSGGALVVAGLVLLAACGTRQPAAADSIGFPAVLDILKTRNAADYAITSDNGIDDARYVELGGIEQWITIRGENRQNPVILLLHGGPGDSTNLWGFAGFRTWLGDFTLVQWDQRGAGRSLDASRPAPEAMTVEQMVQDGLELTEWLRGELQQDKVILVAHSWGTRLGVLMAKARPELFHAYVGTGQVADPARTAGTAYRELVARAQAVRNQRAVDELASVGPPPYPDGRGFAVQRKWSNLFEGADAFLASMLGFAIQAPGYDQRDVDDWLDGQLFSGQHLVPQGNAMPASALGGVIDVPVFVIQGADDFTTPTSLAREWVGSVQAPMKAFVAIEGGHFAAFMRTDLFLAELVPRVRPLAAPRPD